jgi:hypothetical protein
MSDRFRKNTTVGSVAVKKTAVFISLGLVAIFLLACGGSTGSIDDGGSETAIFQPVVFTADKDTSGVIELYASFDDGTDIIKLSETMVFGGDVVDFKVSPNGIWVAYVADQERNDVFELYVVPVDKTDRERATKISGTVMAGDGIKETASGRYAFEWASDTSRVAYLADQTFDGRIELYSNTPDGNSQTSLLLSVLGPGRDVEDFAWSPNLNTHSLIAYRANQDALDPAIIKLYTTSPTSESSQLISSGLSFPSNVTTFKWAPDAERIAFLADKDSNDEFILYTTFPSSINDVQVSDVLAGTNGVINFKWSPNGALLAYLLDLGSSDFQLLTTLRNSRSSTSISSDIEDDQESNYGWSWNSSLIAFIADEVTADVFELFTSDPADVSTKTKVSDDLVSGGDVIVFKWAPTELSIAYTADQDTNDKVELYTTNPPPAAPPAFPATKVSGTPFTGVAVEDDFQWSSDNSSLIAYRADQDTLNKIELYTTDPEGSENDRVSGTLPNGGEVDEFKWDDSGSAIGYLANQISVTVTELFASLPDGADNTRLSSDLVDGIGDPVADSDVSAFEWVP